MALADFQRKISKMPILILLPMIRTAISVWQHFRIIQVWMNWYWRIRMEIRWKSVTILAEIPCLMNRMDTERQLPLGAALILMKFIMRERLMKLRMEWAIMSGHIRLLVKYLSVLVCACLAWIRLAGELSVCCLESGWFRLCTSLAGVCSRTARGRPVRWHFYLLLILCILRRQELLPLMCTEHSLL